MKLTRQQRTYRKYPDRGLHAFNRRRLGWGKIGDAARFVYAIRAGEKALKIGTARNVEVRLLGIATGCPYPPVIAAMYPHENAGKIEKAWHLRLAKYHSNGEWFIVPRRLADKICGLLSAGFVPFRA